MGGTRVGKLWVCCGDGDGGVVDTTLLWGRGVPVPSPGAAGEEVTADVWLPGLGLSCSQLTCGAMGPSFH